MKTKKEKQTPIKEAFDYLEIFVFAAAIVLLLFTVGIRLCTVDGDSMHDTLEHGQMLVVSEVFYTPEVGDIIVFHQSNNRISYLNKPLVKRVLATEGQYCKIKYNLTPYTEGSDIYYLDMAVYVSDDATFEESDKLDESYIDFKEISPKNEFHGLLSELKHYLGRCENTAKGEYVFETQIPEGYVFAVGDNRYNSNDSRLDVGFVDNRCILGKVAFRLSPFGKVE